MLKKYFNPQKTFSSKCYCIMGSKLDLNVLYRNLPFYQIQYNNTNVMF